MWSHLYGYYEIRGSANYDISGDTEDMRAILDSFPELKRVGLISYENAAGYPWISLSLVKSNKGNYHVSNETWDVEFNMIPIVCSKSDNGKVSLSQVELLIKITGILNWELIEEETDESDEEVVYTGRNRVPLLDLCVLPSTSTTHLFAVNTSFP